MMMYSASLLYFALMGVFLPAEATPERKKLSVEAQAEPRPTLHYSFVVAPQEVISGNGAMNYLRAFSPELWGYLQRDNTLSKLGECGGLSDEKFRTSLAWTSHPKSIFAEIERASRHSRCDFKLRERIKEDGINTLLYDIQGFRNIALLLDLRIRRLILEKNYEEAVRHLRMMIRMGQDIGKSGSVICSLVGLAIISIALDRIEYMMQYPDAPNLYWALSTLGYPCINIREAFQSERLMFQKALPEWPVYSVKDLEKEIWSQDKARTELQRFFEKIPAMEQLSRGGNGTSSTKVMAPFYAALYYRRAKQQLLEEGYEQERLEKMPSAQVIILEATKRLERLEHQFFRWAYLPIHELPQVLSRSELELKKSFLSNKSSLPDATDIYVNILTPALTKILQSYIRVERRIACYRTLEALRHHKAIHHSLPENLDEVKDLIVPVDPATQKKFLYKKIDNESFTLQGEPFDTRSINYLITFKK